MVQDYGVFKRKLKKMSIYYVRYKSPDPENKIVTKSVLNLIDLLGEKKPKRITKYRAIEIGKKALDKGLIFPNETKTYFAGYVKAFWDFDSEWVRVKNKENKNSIGKKYVMNEHSFFVKYCEPLLPKGLLLADVQLKHLEKIRSTLLLSDCSSATINKALQSMRSPLSEAYRLGLISNNLSDRIKNVTVHNKLKGIPTKDEITKLIKHLATNRDPDDYYRIDYLIVLLSITTGMRLGEIRGLHKEDIEIVNSTTTIIHLKYSYSPIEGEKCPKNRKPRNIICSTELAKEMLNFSNCNLIDSPYVFWSAINGNYPVGDRFIRDRFNNNLSEIGINKKERVERNITFHSLRHYFTTIMTQCVGRENTRRLLGHQTIAMTEHYTHETQEYLISLDQKRREVFGF